jgi:hypothetical protein
MPGLKVTAEKGKGNIPHVRSHTTSEGTRVPGAGNSKKSPGVTDAAVRGLGAKKK